MILFYQQRTGGIVLRVGIGGDEGWVRLFDVKEIRRCLNTKNRSALDHFLSSAREKLRIILQEYCLGTISAVHATVDFSKGMVSFFNDNSPTPLLMIPVSQAETMSVGEVRFFVNGAIEQLKRVLQPPATKR